MTQENKVIDFKDFIAPVKDIFSPSDIDLVKKAFFFAQKKHEGQKRASGEPYFIHPVQVAQILMELQMDAETLAAALLHDVLEDTDTTYEEIKEKFGKNVALLVDGVTKLGKLSFKSTSERQAENLRKMFLAMIKDIRVMLIKLADRVNNMRTLKNLPPEKQKRIAKETLEIYAPLANRLGIQRIKWELDDLALYYLEPEIYQEIKRKVEMKRKEREAIINEAIEKLEKQLKRYGFKARIFGRPKHFYSIYLKMTRDKIDFSSIYDLIGIRIITQSVSDCYAILGIVHKIWKPIPGRFKDYIAVPKINMYQSLHTTVMYPKGVPLEIQIRTEQMHKIAEDGIAAHWSYKEKKVLDQNLNIKLTWLKKLIEWHKESKDAHEYLEDVKLELFQDEVFTFTPRGEVKVLPAGSTPIDFAYAIHTEVGHRCVGAKVNGKIVPLDYILKNGDMVEILTGKRENPNRHWLTIVKSPAAKNKIKSWFRRHERVTSIRKGKKILEDILENIKVKYNKQLEGVISGQLLNFKKLVKSDRFTDFLKKYSFKEANDFFFALGNNEITRRIVLHELFPEIKQIKLKTTLSALQEKKESSPKKKKNYKKSPVIVEGYEGMLVKLARCCAPIPGDEIIGFITKGKGISVHKTNCSNIKNIKEKERLIKVEWNDKISKRENFEAYLKLVAMDRTGLLLDITNTIAGFKVNIRKLNAIRKGNKAHFTLGIEISSIEKLKKIIKSLRAIPNVENVYRE